jgi:hypothetical protein
MNSLKEHPKTVVVANRCCRKLDLPHLLQRRRPRMKLMAGSQIDEESTIKKAIGSTPKASNLSAEGKPNLDFTRIILLPGNGR